METASTAGPAPGQPAPEPDEHRDVIAADRPSRRPRDLVLSLVVLLVPVFLIVGIYKVVQGGDEPVVVDPGPVLDQARAAGDFPVAVPTGLADQWRPISARYRPGDGQAELRIGYVSPSGAGFLLVQSDGPADELLGEELTTNARPLGTATVGGREWQRYEGRRGERALVLLQPERTVLVVGAGPDAELVELAESLR